MKYFHYLIFVTLPLVILLPIAWLSSFNYSWYDREFAKLGVYQDLDPAQVKIQTANLFNYLNGADALNQEFYTTREILHLTDVKNIVLGGKIFALIITAIFLFQVFLAYFKAGLKKLLPIIFQASVASLAFFILIIILSFLNFEKIFKNFHEIAFSNDFWLLDPEVDKLIVIFQPPLFADLASKIIIQCLAVSVLISVISYVIYKKLKNN